MAVKFPNILNQFILDCIHGHSDAVLLMDYVINNKKLTIKNKEQRRWNLISHLLLKLQKLKTS